MSCALFRVSVFSLAFLWLTGCGGSSSNGGGGGGGGGSEPTIVTVTFAGGTPTAAATQIGSGSFAPAALSGSSLTLSVPSGTTNFAVAYVCPAQTEGGSPPFQLTSEFVVEATTGDGTSYSLFGCPYQLSAGSQTGTLTGSVDASAIPGASFLDIDAWSGPNFSQGAGANFSFAAPTGSDQVDVLAYTETFQGIELLLSLAGAKSFSGQAVPGALNGGSTVVLTAADATTPEAITYNNVPSGFAAPTLVAAFDPAGQDFGIALALGATSQYPALPAGMVQSGDTYDIEAWTNGGQTGNILGGQTLLVLSTFTSGGPVSITFPAPWTYNGPTPAKLPTLDFTYNGFAGKAGVSDSAALYWFPSSTVQREIQISASENYQNGSTSLTFPDLSGLPGFLADPASGSQVTWAAIIDQSSAGVFGGLLQKLPANQTMNEVLDSAEYVVP